MVFKWITSYTTIDTYTDLSDGRYVPFDPASTVGINMIDTYIKRHKSINKYMVANVKVSLLLQRKYWGFFSKQYETFLSIGKNKVRIVDKDLYNIAKEGIDTIPCVFCDNKNIVGLLILTNKI